jgi:hypothetical protein
MVAPFEDAYRFDTFPIDGRAFPRVFLGSSPFIGAGQFGAEAYYYREYFYERPENIARVFVKAAELGCNAFQIIAYPPLLEALSRAKEETGRDFFLFFTIGLGDVRGELRSIMPFAPGCVILHGSYADRDTEAVLRTIEEIKALDETIVTGISTHLPGLTIRRALEHEEIELIHTPINRDGLFMRPSPEATIQAIQAARAQGKAVIGMKILGAGTIPPGDALSYAAGRVDGVALGMTTDEELEETLNAAEREFGKPERQAS